MPLVSYNGESIGYRKHAIPGFVVFGLCGVSSQIILNYLQTNETLSTKRPELHNTSSMEDQNKEDPGFIRKFLSSNTSPIRRLTKEEYVGLMREKKLRVDAEIALLDEEIEQLYKRLEEDDPEAAERLRRKYKD